jgi:hypothetical protein
MALGIGPKRTITLSDYRPGLTQTGGPAQMDGLRVRVSTLPSSLCARRLSRPAGPRTLPQLIIGPLRRGFSGLTGVDIPFLAILPESGDLAFRRTADRCASTRTPEVRPGNAPVIAYNGSGSKAAPFASVRRSCLGEDSNQEGMRGKGSDTRDRFWPRVGTPRVARGGVGSRRCYRWDRPVDRPEASADDGPGRRMASQVGHSVQSV